MKVETYPGTFAILHLIYEPGVDPELLPCPFCGGVDLEIQNTHTPSYWIECHGCEATAHGEYGGDRKTRANHRRAFLSAVRAWNRRTSSAPKTKETP
jgi:hypothetical protein